MTEQAKVPAIRFAGFTDPWEQRKLSEVATFGGGHTPPMADPDNYEDGYVLWVTSQDVKSNYLDRTTTQITEKGAKELTLYPAGSLVMVTRSGILRHTLPVAELRKPSTVNQDIRVILPQGECCGEWLLQFFISHNKELLLEFGKTGTTVESVDFGKIKDMLLYMPSTVEQQQIGDFFAKLDSLITLHQRKYDKLVILKKSMLEKMFPKDGESVPEIRFAGFTDPWEQRKFVDFVEASGIRNKDNLQLESYSVSNDRGFVPQDEQFENGGTMRDADKTAYWIVEPGSFAYNPARINVGSIGYQSTRKNVIVSSLYEVFKTDHSCDDRFLWHWFKSSLFTKQIEMLQEGGVRLYFFFDKLQKSEIWMPNVDEQRIIGQQFDQLDSLITLHQRKLELLQNIKKSLLDKMFA
ncbi:restriction endonuclease subunit S [Bifidobacterium bifidum]|nr:restriction endonuclease S subunit [Bifidobacterium bifidum]